MLADQAKSSAVPDGLAQSLLTTMKLANKLSVLEAFATHGITTSEWLLLSVFPADGTPMTVKRLAALTGLTPSRVKVLLVNLESNGLINGSLAESGRTTQPYSMSQTGLSVEGRVRATVSEFEQSLATPAQVQVLLRANRILFRLSKGFVESTLEKPSEPIGTTATASPVTLPPRSAKRATTRK